MPNNAVIYDRSIKKVDISKDRFPFDDESFDIVFTKSVIEHIIDPSFFLKECRRVLKPAGLIIILTPDWVSHIVNFYDDPTHLRPYTEKSIIKLMQLYGLKNLKTVDQQRNN